MGDCTCKGTCQTCNGKTQKKRRVEAIILNRTDTLSWTGGSHHNQVVSGYFPICFTHKEADYYLQRFMTPTKEAFEGIGNGQSDPKQAPWKTEGLVEMWPIPVDIGIPDTNAKIGYVDIKRGDGWLQNITKKPHPFIGTITVQLMQDGDGFYIQVTGNGVEGATEPGGPQQGQSWDPKPFSDQQTQELTQNDYEGSATAGVYAYNAIARLFQATHPIDNARQAINTALGPVLFQNLCNIAIKESYMAKREACGEVPYNFSQGGVPSTSSWGQLFKAAGGAVHDAIFPPAY